MSERSDHSERQAQLSATKRSLLEKILRREGPAAVKSQIIGRRREGESAPLSFAQQRLWFLDQYEPGSPFYNITRQYQIKGPLDTTALERALNEIVRRHDILRTRFDADTGGPVQLVGAWEWQSLRIIDLSALPEAGRAAEAQRLVVAEARTPFDLSRGPLFRARLLRLGAEHHVLQLTMHHIVSDGWSMGVLLRELSALYRAFRAAAPPPLPDLAVQYADYAVWQREWLRGEALEAQLAYWRRQLGGESEALTLPTDRPRPASQSFRGAKQTLRLPDALAGDLKELGRREGATLFMVMLAAFKVLLHRYTGQEDIVVGTPVANRTRPEAEPLIGFLVNTLVLRTDLGSAPGFRELLGRVREACLGAYQHQDVPFERLVEELRPGRSLSHTPLFQVMFALQNASSELLELGAAAVRELPVDSGVSVFDLTLYVEKQIAGTLVTAQYNTDLFDATTVTRLLSHYERVLEGVTSDPAQRLGDIPLLTDQERRLIIYDFNRTPAPAPPDLTAHALFARQAALHPARPALRAATASLSYAELDARSNRLARRLLSLGLGVEDRAALLLARSPLLVVAQLAVLKAGAAFLPLDPRQPPARLRLMAEDATPRLVLSERRWAHLLAQAPAGAAAIYLDDEGEAARIAAHSAEAVEAGASPGNAAYIIYTSGSTGTPKGVVVTHRGVVRLVKGADYADLDEGEVFLQLAPASFDASTFEIWGALLNGALLVLYPETPLSLEELGQTIADEGITTLWLTAGLFHQMVETRCDGLKGVRQLLAGGDVLSVPHVRKALTELKGGVLINGYGPTENTTFTCCYRMTDVGQVGETVSIGRPIANTQVYILDKNLQPVGIGVRGELFAAGDGLARGYLNRPDLTAERFIPHPLSEEPGARLYRTGDLARYRSDGNIEFLGRADNQVKIRGFRVEPAEIEAALYEHPQVRQAVVMAREETPSDKRLAAYVVAGPEQTPTATELQAFLKHRLPDYMIPSAFVLLDELPLNANGKVDCRALPAPERAASRVEESHVEPRTPVESAVAEAWGEVLRVPRVGVHDNFFDLGGHSLLATQVISRLRGIFRVELPLRKLFESPTVAALARELEMLAHDGGSAPPPLAAGQTTRLSHVPLSFAAQRLWYLDQLNPGDSIYNIPAAFRLKGALNVGALERAFSEVTRRHESLRMNVSAVDGIPVQVISEPKQFRLPLVEVGGRDESERMGWVRRYLSEESQRPFDLSSDPLLRASLLRLSNDEHVLQLTMHHIVSDGWSMGVLLRELSALYRAFRAAAPPPLPDLAVQYADYAVWQREWLRGEALEAQLAYWRRQLGGESEALTLPTDRPRPSVQTFRGAVQSSALPQSLSEELQAVSRREGVTLFMTLLAAFDVLLHRYTGQEDIVVGTPVANRTRPEAEPLIGFLVNTLVLRTDLGSAPGFRELLGRVREACLGAYQHQDVPFERLVEELRPGRSLSHTPLFQVMFALQNAPAAVLSLDELSVQPVAVESANAKFDLLLSVTETAQGLVCTAQYSTDLFEPTTIERLLGHYRNLLQGIAADPSRRVSDLPLLSEGEQHQLLVEWNDTRRCYPQGASLHELFEAQAELTPDAAALTFAGEQVSYRELNGRANQLVHHLRGLGVLPEVPVGICVERSVEMVIGMLGVLKAGGVYVPLDPLYPPGRLAFVMKDTRAKVLLTQKRLLESLPEHDAAVLCLDSDWQATAARHPVHNPPNNGTRGNAAYVIYTSGSTGRPKGVVIEHRSVIAFLHWAAETFAREVFARVLFSTSICFDLSIFELFATLSIGGRVALAESILQLPTLTDAGEVRLVNTVPSAMWELVRAGGLPRSVRVVNLAGEALGRDLVEQVYQQGHVEQIFNLYGPSEDTTYTTFALMRSDDTDAPTIGRPITNTQVYILDGHLQAVPVGVTGEIHIGGAGLARGYLNLPELTAERFIPNPFSEEPGARLYRTGDLARYRSDGQIEFLGRVDHQVKVRGYRIELGEVEAALRSEEAISAAIVVARDDAPGRKRLVAYLVGVRGDGAVRGTRAGADAGDGPLSSGELRGRLKRRLPEYMIPSTFVWLGALPLTPNGKVDRGALPAPEHLARALEDDLVAPRTPEEQTLAVIWEQLLGVKPVGIYDNFFDLGGDSILSLQMVDRARRANLHLTPKQVIQHQTIAELAAVASAGSRIHAEQGVVTGRLPLIPIQHWFFEHKFLNQHHWNMAVLLEVQQRLPAALFEEVTRQVLAHHDSLRLRFKPSGQGWEQTIAGTQGPTPFRLIDLSSLPEPEQVATLERAAAEMQQSLDLTEGPLMRVGLFDLGEQKPARLLLIAHHLTADGVSFRILLEDFQAVCRQLMRGAPPGLPPKTTSYKHWARRLKDYAQSDEVRRELDYWAAEPLKRSRPLPVDFEGGANTKESMRSVPVTLSEEETWSVLHRILAASGSQIDDILITALARAFGEWTGDASALLSFVGHGRETLFEEVDLSRTVGWFNVHYPVLLSLDAAASPLEDLNSIKEQLARVPSHGLGYGLLRYLTEDVEAGELIRSLPEPQVSFNNLGQLDQVWSDTSLFRRAGESGIAAYDQRGHRPYLLGIFVSVIGKRLNVDFMYSENVHRRASIERLAGSFRASLTALIESIRPGDSHEV